MPIHMIILLHTNRLRGRHEPEYELLDTGIFNENRYFDVFVEYAKDSAEDILIRITIFNRGPEDATFASVAYPLVPKLLAG